MSDHIDEIIEKLFRGDTFRADDDGIIYREHHLRAVCEAGIKACRVLNASDEAVRFTLDARRALARELLREGFELIDINGRRRHVIETYKLREIAIAEEWE